MTGEGDSDASRTFICGPDEALAWDEPFLVMTDGGSHECEVLTSCTALSAWMVEMVGWNADGEPPYLPPVRYACMAHVGGAMEGLLPDESGASS